MLPLPTTYQNGAMRASAQRRLLLTVALTALSFYGTVRVIEDVFLSRGHGPSTDAHGAVSVHSADWGVSLDGALKAGLSRSSAAGSTDGGLPFAADTEESFGNVVRLPPALMHALSRLKLSSMNQSRADVGHTGSGGPRGGGGDVPGKRARDWFEHLIMVPGHGVFSGPNFHEYADPDQWALEAFQRTGHNVASFVAHITKAVALAKGENERPVGGAAASSSAVMSHGAGPHPPSHGRPRAMVIFSGGQSRVDAGARSEGSTYLDLVRANPLDFGFADEASVMEALGSQPQSGYLFAEEFSRDSYENLLFSVCRFFEITGRWPKQITVVGYAYKATRFRDYHRMAIRWPLSRFTYVGIDVAPPGIASRMALSLAALRRSRRNGGSGNSGTMTAGGGGGLPPVLGGGGGGDANAKMPGSQRGMKRQQQPAAPSDERTLANVRSDLYLCTKHRRVRSERNPNQRTIPYYSVVPLDVLRLMLFCGPGVFPGALPWTGGVSF